jgi:thiol-disulfide isomerase/thioredoxin
MTNPVSLTLYLRQGCHLCHDMEQHVMSFQKQYGFTLHIVDIDADKLLKLRYGERVPVLAAGEQEICHYFFNKDLLQQYLKAHC